MMGQQSSGQNQLFYDFCIDQYVPTDHLLRQINQVLDLSELRQHLSSFYSHTGRPSIDPELMIRMLLVGYCYGIRSERRLCEEVHLNIAYRWFCRLGLEDQVPDHSTFSKNRHGRFRESDSFRFIFESIVGRCMSEGLVKGEGFATDASVIKADANRQNGVPGKEIMGFIDPASASRPVKEYLQGLEQENARTTTPKVISLVDPQSSWTAATKEKAFFAYSTNYLNRWRNFVKPRSVITKADTIIYRARKTDRDNCSLKHQYCPTVDFRKIARSIHESSRDVAREIGKTPEHLQSRKDRKKIEVLFAHLKRILKLERLRLRGLSGANDEFLLAASVQNLKKLAKLRYKPPDIEIVAPI